MTVADPFDEVIYRALVGQVAWDIDWYLGSEVQSYRLDLSGSVSAGWRTRDNGYAQRIRRSTVESQLGDPGFAGLVSLDVRSYYPSIDRKVLAGTLIGLGALESDVAHVTRWLELLCELWGVSGVPIGPETSGLLGNAYLIPVDRELRGIWSDFHRYSDDYRVWLSAGTSPETIVQVVQAATQNIGLALNLKKVRFHETKEEVRKVLFDDELDLLDRLRGSDKLLAAKVLFDSEIAAGFPSIRRIKYCIGIFNAHHSPHGLNEYRINESLMLRVPKAWGRYIGSLHRAHKVDPDWLASAALGEISPMSVALRTHLMLACSRGHNNAAYGEQFHDVFMAREKNWIPFRCAAAGAWMTSDHWRSGRAVDSALAIGDAQRKRAAALTLRQEKAGSKVRRGLAKLRAAEPVCAPAATWIESGKAERAA